MIRRPIDRRYDRRRHILIVGEPVEVEDDTIVNEDDSGDAILFENDDTWVTE